MVKKITYAQLMAQIASRYTTFLPSGTECADVHDLCKLAGQGRSSVTYSFLSTFFLQGSKHQKEFILKVYNEGNQEKGRKEFALLNVLKEQKLPVPTAYYFEDENTVYGKAFMIMERIKAKNASFYLHTEESTKQIVKKMAECLARIHGAELDFIKNFDVLRKQYELKQKWLSEIRFFTNKRCMGFLGFCPPPQRRFIATVKQLGYMEPKKVYPTLVHLDYEPNHVLVLNGRCIVLDWGEASIGDPAYDVSWTYHKLRLGRERAKLDAGEYFVKCYEKHIGQKLVNLQFFKDMVAIEIASWCGLSPFYANRSKNYRKLLALFFGDFVGEVTRQMHIRNLRSRMAGHHTDVWSNINYIQSYALRYLEKDRYKTIEPAETID